VKRRRKAFYWTDAANWIAANDETSDMDVGSISELVSVCMIEDLTGVNRMQIAEHIVFMRQQWESTKHFTVQSLRAISPNYS